MSQFNLIDEAWIPVCKLDGERVELGIRDVLLQAKEIAVIEDPSPLVTAALHRFLLAVLYRALEGPTDIDQAKALFKAGLPADKLEAYLERWRDRFGLFDEKYPFFQIPDFEPKVWRAWTVLAAEHNADNAKVLFDHVDVTRPDSVTPAAAARWLLATQTYSVSAGKSELSHTGTAPSATAAMILPLGRHLEDTLLLNLVPQNRAVLANDLPVWERKPETVTSLKAGAERNIAGYADRYTWRTRSIRLRGEEYGNVSTLAFASGVENATKDHIDPMLGYRIDDKNGKLPIQFRERGLWRDFDSLLPDDTKLAPEAIENATVLTRFDRTRFPRSVMVLGQSNNKAKIEFWRLERFALPEALLGDRAIRTEIHQLLADAEANQQALWRACKSFARDLLSRGERNPDTKDISRFVEQMPVSAAYWSTLEAAFHEVLRHYTADSDPDAIRLGWLKTVRATLRDAWRRHALSVSTSDAWAIRALVRAEAHINKQVGALNKEIQQYETHRQSQEETA
ncbi:type I-E CRISPR-associated protein Cse1/CasA [Acidithiobacillus sp. CV18-2]|nr:type I-E CRISPR-associated protein Cse1/CasA [Acidithiobacillus sp. CV18-3]MBU2758327.1 type I-E CRISPR-associated protein Cse1/CasA [Acidithiobacillus sp. BN09-2]MBU2775950.1 type I-E CRISPR-associated protein Cse1/CasA [Acidithiobacillus sp. CV18-2]MBU2798842.1 type I-E CRISPR-associated protein Cse1/CasA [Acidithiobacillus sp. VAN18-4]